MKKVVIYTTPSCTYCVMAKKFFKENKVDFEEVDVAANQSKTEEMIKKSGQMGVPVTIIGEGKNEEVLIGFDQAKMQKALEL